MTTLPAGLEVCPFCGSDNVKLRTDSKAAMSWVACISCGLEAPTETGVSSEEAVAYWNRRAARSTVPEAWEAVDESAKEAWNSVSDEYNQWGALSLDERDTFVAFAAALASVPAPSGAEPPDELAKINAALAKAEIVLNPIPDGGGAWHYEASVPQAVPAEDVDVADLIERLNETVAMHTERARDTDGHYYHSIVLSALADEAREAVTALTSLSARLAATETARYVAATNYLDLVKYKERLEAEATSLRRKLEEHRKALEHVRAIISEGAMVGFNPLDGTWAERLYASQGMTHAVLNPARGASE